MWWSLSSWASVIHKGANHLGTNRNLCRKETKSKITHKDAPIHVPRWLPLQGIAAVQPHSPMLRKWASLEWYLQYPGEHIGSCNSTSEALPRNTACHGGVLEKYKWSQVHCGARGIRRTGTYSTKESLSLNGFYTHKPETWVSESLFPVNLPERSIRTGHRKESDQKNGSYKSKLIWLTHYWRHKISLSLSIGFLLHSVEITGKVGTRIYTHTKQLLFRQGLKFCLPHP